MSKRRKKSAAPANDSNVVREDTPTTPGKISSGKLWFFRFAALVGVPVVFLGLLELTLRLVGFGYPTAFLLPSSNNGQKTFVQNNQFGWRFFGRQLARLPYPISIPQTKTPNTIRIFVLGGSAAKGDPLPEFGLPRMLEAMLSLRHPGVRFEMVNAAMTAINSYAVLPIARDCAKANGDIWVIYMGNNEVVGPFGAGTVFNQQTPPLPLIRATLALKATRTGQLLDSLRQRIQKAPSDRSEWGGMKMFLSQKVRADDPRMNTVYHNFEQNLADIIRAGQRSGAAIVVSTVAVNLKDCAPFASVHRPGLSESDTTKWNQFYQLGVKAQSTGENQEAFEDFREAMQMDDHFADLRFRQGQCALALGKISEAQTDFNAARDLDALRFRCDSRLNDLIRRTVSNWENQRILLADGEHIFAGQSPDGLPGENYFYEHVHLTFDGNYLLAKTIAEQIEKLLPKQVVSQVAADQPWPSEADCARRLAWSDWNRFQAFHDILDRISQPPFTAQLNHEEQLKQVKVSLQNLIPATQPAGINAAREICEEALVATPDDPALYEQLASLKMSAGDFAGAATAVQKELKLLPSDSEAWSRLGLVFLQQKQFANAAADFQMAFHLDPDDALSLQNLAQLQWMLGRHEEAIRDYHRALVINPNLGMIWVNLGQSLEEMGRTSEAENCYHQALSTHSDRASDLVMLARFCQSRGWFKAAATNYDKAIELNPVDAELQVEAGRNLARLGRFAEAKDHYAEAARLSPGFAEAHFLYGFALGRENSIDAAAEQFRKALQIQPDMQEARLDLGVALVKQGRISEAGEQFEKVLQQNPTNATAIQYLQELRANSNN